MSTGLECEVFEAYEGRWFYSLQDGGGSAQTWDWREYAFTFGPFTTYEAACKHLGDNHANTGGHSITPHDQAIGEIYQQLVREASKPAK